MDPANSRVSASVICLTSTFRRFRVYFLFFFFFFTISALGTLLNPFQFSLNSCTLPMRVVCKLIVIIKIRNNEFSIRSFFSFLACFRDLFYFAVRSRYCTFSLLFSPFYFLLRSSSLDVTLYGQRIDTRFFKRLTISCHTPIV